MNFDPSYPVYLGMSKKEFTELRKTGRLHHAKTLNFTSSMKEAEQNAKTEALLIGEEKGMVVKFDTENLFKHPTFNGGLITEFIDNIFKFIVGFYEVIEIIIEEGGEYC